MGRKKKSQVLILLQIPHSYVLSKIKMKYWVNGAQSRTLRTLILKKGKNIKGTLNSNYVVKTNKESTTDPFHEQVKSTCPSESRYYIAQAALKHLILSHL